MKNINTIGAFYGNSGKIAGADEGARMLKSYADTIMHNSGQGTEIEIGPDGPTTPLEETAYICRQLRDAVKESLALSKITLVLGGDHSIAAGSIAGVLENNAESLGVVYIDAHADMNTPETSPTGNIHGMPLAICMGLGPKSLTELMPCKLDSSRLLMLGTRSVDPGEAQLIASNNIDSLSSDFILTHTIDDIERHFQEFIKRNGITTLHVSFDIDVIDPSEAPGTGVPEPCGISKEQALALLDMLLRSQKVRSIDLVEYNPLLDTDNKTLQIYKLVIDRICK